MKMQSKNSQLIFNIGIFFVFAFLFLPVFASANVSQLDYAQTAGTNASGHAYQDLGGQISGTATNICWKTVSGQTVGGQIFVKQYSAPFNPSAPTQNQESSTGFAGNFSIGTHCTGAISYSFNPTKFYSFYFYQTDALFQGASSSSAYPNGNWCKTSPNSETDPCYFDGPPGMMDMYFEITGPTATTNYSRNIIQFQNITSGGAYQNIRNLQLGTEFATSTGGDGRYLLYISTSTPGNAYDVENGIAHNTQSLRITNVPISKTLWLGTSTMWFAYAFLYNSDFSSVLASSSIYFYVSEEFVPPGGGASTSTLSNVFPFVSIVIDSNNVPVTYKSGVLNPFN